MTEMSACNPPSRLSVIASEARRSQLLEYYIDKPDADFSLRSHFPGDQPRHFSHGKAGKFRNFYPGEIGG